MTTPVIVFDSTVIVGFDAEKIDQTLKGSLKRESGIGSDVMKRIAAPIVGVMITSTIHVLILVPMFFLLIKRRARRRGALG
jgi:hypothetical protein